MRFNPPPNWPPVPPGWAPDSNWVPDPSLPPPPPGWPLWVDDGAPQYPSPFAVEYPAQYPPMYPPQWPPPPAARPKARLALWASVAAVAVVAIAVVVAVVVFGPGGGAPSAGGEKPSKKSDITQLTQDLLVGKSAFPDPGGPTTWRSGLSDIGPKRSGPSDLTINPRECANLYGNPQSATQAAAATLAGAGPSGMRMVEVHLAITADKLSLKDFLQKCRTFTASFEAPGHTITLETQVDPLDASGVPPWAVGAVMKSSTASTAGIPGTMSMAAATVSGYYRGVFVVAAYNALNPRPAGGGSIDPDAANNVVKLFNAQVEKLEAAP